MKKIMFALAAVAMAVCAQAASIDWTIGANSWFLADGTSKAAKGTTVYLINTANLTDIQNAMKNGTTTFKAGDTGILGVSTTANTKGLVNSTTATSDSLKAGTSYNFAYMVITDGKYFVSGTQAETAYDPTDAVYSETKKVTFAASDYKSPTVAWTTIPTQDPDPDPGSGPEPTSALLLTVGGALLALRRKQK